MITSKNLYTLVVDEINARLASGTAASSVTSSGRQTDLFNASAVGGGASSKEILSAVYSLLQEVLPSQILEGLEVRATTPESNQIVVSAGKGTAGGNVYEITEEATLTVPLINNIKVWYVIIYEDKVSIESYPSKDALIIAKIIVPVPGTTTIIYDVRPNSWDGYIQSYKEYKLYGFNERLEEDSIELLRDNIGEIFAGNIFGNLELSENLTISNVSGTLQLNSDSLKFFDFNGKNLTTFNSSGIYFYNSNGLELAKFTTTGAHIGDMVLTPTSLESRNFVSGSSGFQLQSNGDFEINGLIVRGTVYATAGEIGGWTIASSELYATTTGTIKTSLNAGLGYDGVVLDKDGIRVYDSILGEVVNLPSDGSAPVFSSGIIRSVIFELYTSSVIRTSETVGDGSSSSAGLLMNNTGLYGCGANQTLADANFKVLTNGDAYFKGELQATSGTIGGVQIQNNQLVGGTIVGTQIIGGLFQNSTTAPRIRIDSNGLYYQVITSIGKYGEFKYNDGTHYGSGILAFLFNPNYPVLSVVGPSDMADIRFYNRRLEQGVGAGPHEIGDVICVDGVLKMCSVAGSPGIFISLLRASSADYSTIFFEDLGNTDLADPDADGIMFWDDSATQYRFLSLGTGLSITDTTLSVSQNLPITLLSTTNIPLDAAGDTTIYKVPPGKRCILTQAILIAGAAATSNTISIGQDAQETDWIPAQALTNLAAANDVVNLLPIPSVATTPLKGKSYTTDTVIQARVAGTSGGATNTLHLFGMLY